MDCKFRISILFFSALLLLAHCQQHGHSHDHHGHSHGDHDHHGHAHDHHDDHHGHSHDKPASFKYSQEANEAAEKLMKQKEQKTLNALPGEEEFDVWLTAIGSTVLISIAPIFILFLIPLEKSPSYNNFLKLLLSFASGGLLGDAFLHLIPHALMAQQLQEGSAHGHSHDGHEGHSHDMGVGLWILAGIVVFLAVEKMVRVVKGKHGHSHAVDSAKKADGDAKTMTSKDTQEDIKVSAYLNLAADFTHNFTDGLAIGSSYLVSRNVGMITTLTILLHEVPHEIGDFAILVQSGCSKKKAMLLQLTTAVGAVVGTVVSLMAEGASDSANSWVLPFTAGGFIYIATVSVIPELLSDTKLGQSLKEIAAMLMGILMMILIASFE